MADNSSIEWTQSTWNPTTGCDRVSPGCDNCYALKLAGRLKLMGQARYQVDGNEKTSGPGFGVTLHPDALDVPRRWRRPRLIFVNSMSDLFHARVPLDYIRDVFNVMEERPQHTYQILTKRSLRLARIAEKLSWPANVWMGVSVEGPEQLKRIDHLRAVPAAVRFISAEPLLGPLTDIDLTDIHWVIAGGESGFGARPVDPEWVRSLRDVSNASGVAFFFKQWGAWRPAEAADAAHRRAPVALDGPVGGGHVGAAAMVRVGKTAAGRLLDGRMWDEFPRPHVKAGVGGG